MTHLAWIDAGSDSFLPAGAVVVQGKQVTLHASALGPRTPKEFQLYEVPSKAVEWALRQVRRRTRELVLRVPAVPNGFRRAPPQVRESAAAVMLASGGLLHRQRWQFSCGSHWSPLLRTPRMASITLSTSSSPGYATVGVTGTIAAPVDPQVEIHPVLPWVENDFRMTVVNLLAQEMFELPSPGVAHDVGSIPEIEGAAGFPEVAIPSPVVRSADGDDVESLVNVFSSYLPLDRPRNFEIELSTRSLFVQPYEEASFTATINPGTAGRWSMGFVALDVDTKEPVAASEVILFESDGSGTLTFFAEGV